MSGHHSKSQFWNCLILALAIVMVVIVCRFLFILESPLMGEIGFRETICGMTLEPYYDEKEDIYYLFLPSYVSTSDIEVFHSDLVKVSFSDGITEYGENLERIPLQENVTITLRNFTRKEEVTVEIWQCENLSTIYLEPLSGSLEDVNADKEYELDTSVIVIGTDGTIELNEPLGTLSGRGNGTWGHAKHPYNLTLSSAVDIGPFESVTAFCMLANYSDESRIRNAVCYYAGDSLGISYASPYMNVDVFVGGEYLGLYGLATKSEYEKKIESDQIKAVFEMKISGTSQNEESFDADFANRVKIMYGNSGDIQNAVGQLETALRTQDWDLCHSVIDLHSFAEKYVFEEFVANYDFANGNRYLSKYFYLDQNDIIHCMLPWDYDWSLGYSQTFFNDLQVYELKTFRSPDNWFVYLLQDELFQDEIVRILSEEMDEDYLNTICQYVNDLTTAIDASWQCELCRWKNQRSYTSWENSSGIKDMRGYAEYFINYFYERHDFLLTYFSQYDEYCKLELRSDFGNTDPEYFSLVVPKGTDIWTYMENANILDTTRNSNYEFSGWYTENGLSINEIDTITEDMTFLGTWTKIEKVGETEETVASEDVITDSENSENLIKRFYHGFGLDSFGWKRLLLCGVFALAFLGLIIGEIVRCIRRKERNNG